MNIHNALRSLGITEWVLRGEPTNETEFNAMFTKVIGADANGSAIESSDPADFGVTWAEITAEVARLQAEYDNNEYQRQRAQAYPSMADQLDTIYHEGIDAWKAQIAAVKQTYPKGGI